MSDIHLWYVNMYILYNNIYKSFHPDAEVCVLWASHALRISHATTYTVHMLYVLYCRWLFKEAYILVWHMTTKAGLAHSIIKSFRPEDQIIIAVYAFLAREHT